MPNPINLKFEIDAATWPNGQPPAPLVHQSNVANITLDLDLALLNLGLITRPPTIYGFSLSDCWAWMRYFSAFQSGSPVRLRHEWTDIDPHHKTVASGDFGVGFGTLALSQLLQFQRYADALWVVNTLDPTRWQISGNKKRGPNKSPDYIAYDNNNEISIVECKGSQSSIGALKQALHRGIPQKASLTALGGQQVIHQLAVGTFVPQFKSKETALIRVVDPEGEDSRDELKRYSSRQITSAIDKVSAAQELGGFGLHNTSSAILRRKAISSFEQEIQLDFANRRDHFSRDSGIRVEKDLLWMEPVSRDNHRFSGVRFSADLPPASIQTDFLESIHDVNSTGAHLQDARCWSYELLENGAAQTSPLGATYRIEWLE